MAQLQAYSCNAVTGAVIDRVPVSAFSWSRLLSAGDSGTTATVPIDGTFSKVEMRNLFGHWQRMLIMERDGAVEYMGYITGRGYQRGQSALTLEMTDLWSLFERRGAWDHSAANVEKWKTTVTSSLPGHAIASILRGRGGGPALPAMGMPLTLPGSPAGTIARTYFGYHLETVGDQLADMLAEGLDIYFKPRWIANGEADWLAQLGIGWQSGVTRELYVTAESSPVSGFGESGDGARVTNNARYIGEGSEEDMLVRSARNTASTLPLLDRMTQAKNVTNVAQLSQLATQDLTTYGFPTFQWDFTVTADTPIDVGDTVRLHFDGDPWIADGWHERRVVKIAGDLSEMKTISVQSTGGA